MHFHFDCSTRLLRFAKMEIVFTQLKGDSSHYAVITDTAAFRIYSMSLGEPVCAGG